MAQGIGVNVTLVRMKRLKKPAPGTDLYEENGFILLEFMVVIAIILIMASFAAPIYRRIITRSHEAVLKDDLFTMRNMINQYTLDNHKPPESRDDLVKSGRPPAGC